MPQSVSVPQFIKPIVQSTSEFFKCSELVAIIILSALALVLIALIVSAIVCPIVAKKKKQKALVKAKQNAEDESVKQNSIVQKANDTVKEQPKPEQPEEEVNEENQPEPQVKDESVKKTLNGKWVVEIKGEGEYMSKLLASNGEVMLSSEIYSSEEGARAGIATIIRWVEDGQFVIYQDKKKNFYYKLKTAGNRLVCVGEIYSSEEKCKSAVESVKRIAKNSPVSSELVEGARYIDYKPEPFTEDVKGLKGKWKIEKLENGKFSARLYASNGQFMISTEEVSARKNAVAGIEAVKKNAIAGNFIVEKDKSGRYYYKLRNVQKIVICIGETYDTLEACINSLESVRKFAVNSVVVAEQVAEIK